MPVLGNQNPTIRDVVSRMDSKGVQAIVEILNETNEVLDDATFMECNDKTGHKTTIRTGIPKGTWRKLYGGVQPTKSTTTQVRDTTGMLEAYAESDKDLVDASGDPNGFRLSEDRAHLEGMNQSFVDALFYGDEKLNPEKITGFAPRYSDLSAENADNIINAQGAGADNTSIWLVVWSPNTVHCLYPTGSKAGIHHENKGQVTVTKQDGSMFEAYRTHYKMNPGLSVRDWRYVVRIANIDVSELTKDASGNSADLIDLMDQAIELIPNIAMGRAAFYCNRTVRSYLRRQIKNHKNVRLSMNDVVIGGKKKKVLHYDDIPVKRCDAILNTEAALS